MEEEGRERSDDGPIFRDIRRYYCEYCGICRSKKALITSHIHTHHQEEIKDKKVEEKKEAGPPSYSCEECGATFRKPAYLEQHMRGHSLEYQVGGPPAKLHQVSLNHAQFDTERPFTCPVNYCNSSYRRKDHLNRHILQHQGKLFKCPVEGCNKDFAFQGNMTRHVKEYHDDELSSDDTKAQEYVCPEIECGKAFKYASRLQKHEDSHVKLDTTEVICCEPGCMKYFANEECLRAHLKTNHLHILCEICGTKQLKKNIKRHLRTHQAEPWSSERIKCDFPDCLHTFATRSNLNQHVKAVHLELRPHPCRIAGCGMMFPFKHVRDNHEKTSLHTYTLGDFVQSDEQFRLKPRGGRKRQCPTIESLMRKRITPPSFSDISS